jgi:hypothetical protein
VHTTWTLPGHEVKLRGESLAGVNNKDFTQNPREAAKIPGASGVSGISAGERPRLVPALMSQMALGAPALIKAERDESQTQRSAMVLGIDHEMGLASAAGRGLTFGQPWCPR